MLTEPKPLEREKVVWGRIASIDADLRCAATTNGGVLITGPRVEAEAIAFEIHHRRNASLRPFEVVDCGDPDCLRTLGRANQVTGGTVFLRNVHQLSPSLQAKLFTQISDRRRRVMAWSQECPDESLDPKLFYRLNMVHIALS